MAEKKIDWSQDGDYWYPDFDTTVTLEQIEPYLKARNPEKYYAKHYGSSEDGEDRIRDHFLITAMVGAVGVFGYACFEMARNMMMYGGPPHN